MDFCDFFGGGGGAGVPSLPQQDRKKKKKAIIHGRIRRKDGASGSSNLCLE